MKKPSPEGKVAEHSEVGRGIRAQTLWFSPLNRLPQMPNFSPFLSRPLRGHPPPGGGYARRTPVQTILPSLRSNGRTRRGLNIDPSAPRPCSTASVVSPSHLPGLAERIGQCTLLFFAFFIWAYYTPKRGHCQSFSGSSVSSSAVSGSSSACSIAATWLTKGYICGYNTPIYGKKQ